MFKELGANFFSGDIVLVNTRKLLTDIALNDGGIRLCTWRYYIDDITVFYIAAKVLFPITAGRTKINSNKGTAPIGTAARFRPWNTSCSDLYIAVIFT